MTTPILFKEYIWLVETIHKARKITLAELNNRWLETEGLPHYDTPQLFLKHFAQLGIAPLPDVSSINRIFSKMVGKFPNWTFVNKDKTETVRRNNVGRRYLNAYKNEK